MELPVWFRSSDNGTAFWFRSSHQGNAKLICIISWWNYQFGSGPLTMELPVWFRSSDDGTAFRFRSSNRGNAKLIHVFTWWNCQIGSGLQLMELPVWFRSSDNGTAFWFRSSNQGNAKLIHVFGWWFTFSVDETAMSIVDGTASLVQVLRQTSFRPLKEKPSWFRSSDDKTVKLLQLMPNLFRSLYDRIKNLLSEVGSGCHFTKLPFCSVM